MIEIRVTINGMMCSMCEAHINDAIRGAFNVEKVTSSRKKNRTVIVTNDDISDDKLKQLIESTGYEFVSVERSLYKKKGLFG